MSIALIYDFPPFDTGLYEATTFTLVGGDAQLVIRVAEVGEVVLRFQRARWHEYTAMYNCRSDQVETSYFKLVELRHSETLQRYVRADQASVKAYRELHHYRIFVPEHGCHELFAESASGTVEGGPSGPRSRVASADRGKV